MSFLTENIRLYEEIINCVVDDSDDAVTIGQTRRGEVTTFVEKVMQGWINHAPVFPDTLSLSPAQRQQLLANRFCTYQEFEQLFYQPRNSSYEQPIYILLGIDDEQKRRRYESLYTKSPDGYFKLMEDWAPALKTFFFPGGQGEDTGTTKTQAYLYSWWYGVRQK